MIKAILITGGLGFIGRHTAKALAILGENCVITQHSVKVQPHFIQQAKGSRLFIEPLDTNDRPALRKLSQTYKITGIIHLAAGSAGVFDAIRSSVNSLSNVLEVAHHWNCKRVIVASTIGVYNGISELPWKEEQTISCSASFPVEAYKKSNELFCRFISTHIGMECISVRIAGVYGPLSNAGKGKNLAGKLVHAAVKGTKPDLSNIFGSYYADDGFDWCYVKDCGRALAALQTASSLNHQIYNVGSGGPVRNHEFIEAIRTVYPKFAFKLPRGNDPAGLKIVPYLDITRLREDTGFKPAYNILSGVQDYISWLKSAKPE